MLWIAIWAWVGWVIFVNAVVQGGVLFWAWSTLLSKSSWSLNQILSFSLAAPLLAGLPGILLLFLRDRRQSAVVRMLMVAILAGLLLTLPRVLLAPTATYAAALTRSAISAGVGLMLWWRTGRRGALRPRAAGQGGLLLLIALLLLLPWLRLGALGDGLDTLIALMQAGSLALLLAGLAAYLIPYLHATSPDYNANVWMGGVLLATAGFVIAGSWGQMDTQALLAGVLPALGFPLALMPAHEQRYHFGSAFVLVIVAAMGPFAFADPRETNILTLLDCDVARWTLWATTLDFILGWPIAIALALSGRRLLSDAMPTLWRGISVMGVAAAIVFYATSGQPGFYGDDFFVVLRSQADLSAAAQISDVDARRAWVYQTLVDHADSSQGDLIAWLQTRDISFTRYYLVNGIEVHASAWRRWQIARRSDVDRILYSPTLRPLP